MKTSSAEVLSLARSKIGVTEIGTSNDVEFTRWHGHVGWPWCAIFCSWLLYVQCHANGEKSPVEGIDYPYGPAYSGSFMVAGQNGTNGLGWSPNPVLGSFAIYDWDWKGMTDHIGIVSQVHSTAAFAAIEGNTSSGSGGSQSDGGGVHERERSNVSGYVRGFVTVPYGAGGGGAPKPPSSKIVKNGSAAPAWPGRMFALTSPFLHGNDVKAWQDRMRWRGYSITADGVYGPASKAACIAFQRGKGLAADGVVGPVTWKQTWELPVTA